MMQIIQIEFEKGIVEKNEMKFQPRRMVRQVAIEVNGASNDLPCPVSGYPGNPLKLKPGYSHCFGIVLMALTMRRET
jgi:hypothetical protein